MIPTRPRSGYRDAMKPAPFDYLRADDEEEALEALAEAGDDARLLAGGQTLMPMLNMRLVEPAVLIDISRLPGRGEISDDGAVIEVGAAATQADLEAWPPLARRAPLLAQALPLLGHVQTRSRGTVCGSIAFADPSAELPLCLATCREARRCCARAPAHGPSLRPNSKPGCCRPPAGRTKWWRQCASPPLSRAQATPSPSSRGATAISPSSPSPPSRGRTACSDRRRRRSPSSRSSRTGHCLDGSALDDALNALAWSLDAADDAQASARYRRELVRGLGKRAVRAAEDARP